MADAPDRPNIKMRFSDCEMIKPSAGDSFVAFRARGRGPVGLCRCNIHIDILANALRGSMRPKELELRWSGCGREEHLLMIAGALAKNRSLDGLKFDGGEINDTAWRALCRALKAHPTLRVLHFGESIYRIEVPYCYPESRSHALARLMRSNTVLRSIQVHPSIYDYNRHIFEKLVVPRVEMNRSFFAEQRTALRQAHISVRPHLFGRALAVVRFNPDLFFKFVSENADVVAAALGGNSPPRHGN